MSLRMMVAGLMVLTAIGLGMIAFQLYQPPPPAPVVQQQQPAPPPPPRAKYLVAARPLPAGTLARDEDFRAVDMEPGKMPEGTLQDTPEVRADLRGALIRNYIDPRQPITPEALLRPRDRGFLAAVLAPGTRATSVPVDPVTGVSGLIWPGDRVDILLVQDLPDAAAAQRIVSETILSDVRVIAVDQHIVQGASAAEGNTGYSARTVTLQVSEDEAQRLSVAARIGRMQLLIRSAEPPPVAVVPESVAVFGGDVSPVLGRRSTLVGLKVRVIQGDAATEVTFK
jgi:pilus assembly protein CpaB